MIVKRKIFLSESGGRFTLPCTATERGGIYPKGCTNFYLENETPGPDSGPGFVIPCHIARQRYLSFVRELKSTANSTEVQLTSK